MGGGGTQLRACVPGEAKHSQVLKTIVRALVSPLRGTGQLYTEVDLLPLHFDTISLITGLRIHPLRGGEKNQKTNSITQVSDSGSRGWREGV
jgi:hypothetical protein